MTGCSNSEPMASKSKAPVKRIWGIFGNAEPARKGRRLRCWRWYWVFDSQQVPRGGAGRHVNTEWIAKARNHLGVASALPHSEGVGYKPEYGEISMCLQVGRMGPISVDGAGQNNPLRSEGPWGRAVKTARTAVLTQALVLIQCRGTRRQSDSAKTECKPSEMKGMPGAGLTGV